MGEKTKDIVDSIKELLKEGPKSISEISKELGINWRTAENYLEILEKLGLVDEVDNDHTRIYFYKDKNNYFELYVRKKDGRLISSIYHQIKKICQEKFGREPTMTQVYKIIWNVNNKLKLNLPIGWYRYGPCSVQIYQGNEDDYKIDSIISKSVKETTEEYCSMDSSSLQDKIYKDEGKEPYLTKKKLMELKDSEEDKEELNNILMDMIKFSPKEAIEVVTDFARATLLLGWGETRECFNDHVWKYITMVIFKESLEGYYKKDLAQYFDKKIEQAKKESQLLIADLVKTHVEAKHSQDKLYQRWVKKKK